MSFDPEMMAALAACEFPVLEIARLLDAMVAEFNAMDPAQKISRGKYCIGVITKIRELSAAYTRLCEARVTGSTQIH